MTSSKIAIIIVSEVKKLTIFWIVLC